MSTAVALHKNEKRSIRKIWKTLRMHHLGLAFFWACSMLTFRSTFLLSTTASTPHYATLILFISLSINATTLFGISSLIESNQSRFKRLPAWPFAALIMAGLIILHVLDISSDTTFMPFLVGGSIFTGIGYGYFWGSWAEVYGQMHPSRTSFYIPTGFLLTTLIFLIISFAYDWFNIPVLLLMLPLPLISLACLRRSQKETFLEPPQVNNNKTYLKALGSLWGLIVTSLILSCLFGFAWEMTVFSVGSVNEAHQLPLVLNFGVALILVALVLYAKTRIDLNLVYQIIIPLIVCAFVILPFFWDKNPVTFNAIISASYGIFDVIIWYLVVSTAYDFSASGFVIGGLVRALSLISRLLGIGIAYIVMMIPDRPPMIIIGISLGALYLLGMLFVLSKRRKLSPSTFGAEQEESEASLKVSLANTEKLLVENDTSLEKACEILVEEYGLTRREAEVLRYLARGRSAKVIASSLFVTESTIRTHTRKILEKTDLHSKQAVIDLVEQYQ